MSPAIFFYIPGHFWPARLPATSAENWAGFGLGIYAWTVQTHLKLREAGVVCHLTSQFPDEGIILFHANAAREATITPGPKRLLICLKAESPLCAQAQLHVVQNPCEASSVCDCHFIPHWPQPGLLSRRPERQNRFENIAFLGHYNSLAADLLSPRWQAELQQRELRWISVVNTNPWNSAQSIDTRWNDYQHIDAIVAVRRFHLARPGYRSKPATKLYNAWLAGVPAILGRELAYRATGRVGVDYLEANCMDDLLSCLDLLQQDVVSRTNIVQQGHRRAAQYTSVAITERWQQFLHEVAVPMYHRWCDRPFWQQQIYQRKARVLNYCDRTRRRLPTLISLTGRHKFRSIHCKLPTDTHVK